MLAKITTAANGQRILGLRTEVTADTSRGATKVPISTGTFLIMEGILEPWDQPARLPLPFPFRLRRLLLRQGAKEAAGSRLEAQMFVALEEEHSVVPDGETQ